MFTFYVMIVRTEARKAANSKKNRHTDITTYGLNWPRGRFIKKLDKSAILGHVGHPYSRLKVRVLKVREHPPTEALTFWIPQ